MFISKLLGISFLYFLAAGGAAGGQRNVTIDDQYGDEITHIVPTYLPLSNVWNIGPGNEGLARPNASLAYKGTWHDATHPSSDTARIVNFGFIGVSIYVYCIIANTPPGQFFDAFADYRFLLDGDVVGEYRHDVENITDYLYDTPVYINTTMENKFHNFSIVVNSTERPVLLLFDYATYTIIEEDSGVASTSTLASTRSLKTDQPTDTPEKVDSSWPSQDVEIIVQVGATLGVLAFFILMGTLIFLLRKKSHIPGQQVTTLQQIFGAPKYLAAYGQSIYRRVIRSLASRSGESGGLVEDRGQTSIAQGQPQSKEVALDNLPRYSP